MALNSHKFSWNLLQYPENASKSLETSQLPMNRSRLYLTSPCSHPYMLMKPCEILECSLGPHCSLCSVLSSWLDDVIYCSELILANTQVIPTWDKAPWLLWLESLTDGGETAVSLRWWTRTDATRILHGERGSDFLVSRFFSDVACKSWTHRGQKRHHQ